MYAKTMADILTDHVENPFRVFVFAVTGVDAARMGTAHRFAHGWCKVHVCDFEDAVGERNRAHAILEAAEAVVADANASRVTDNRPISLVGDLSLVYTVYTVAQKLLDRGLGIAPEGGIRSADFAAGATIIAAIARARGELPMMVSRERADEHKDARDDHRTPDRCANGRCYRDSNASRRARSLRTDMASA